MKRAKAKEFAENNVGKDKIVGRPIRLNKKTLIHYRKDRAEVLFFGDVHFGHPQCLIEKATAMLNWALENKVYVLLMGDLMEAGLKDSVGTSVYDQEMNPQEQMEFIVKLLTPLAEAELIIGIHEGNHEARITKAAGVNITKIMANMLDISYLGYSCWSLLKVGSQNYSIYSTHGSSGSRFKHTKLKAVVDLLGWIEADIVAMGHLHSVAAEPVIRQRVNMRNKIVEDHKCYVVLTGSYLNWDGSYAQSHNYPITKVGSPKGYLFPNEKEVHFTL